MSVAMIEPIVGRLGERWPDLRRGRETRLYVIREHTGLVKIGTTLDPAARLEGLQLANAYPLVLELDVPAKVAFERFVHGEFADERVRGEWFRVSPRLREFIAWLESAVEVQADMAADDEDYEPCADDTIAWLVYAAIPHGQDSRLGGRAA